MSGVPEHHGLMRSALVGSLLIHLALVILPWGGLVDGEGDEGVGAGDFEVSLIPGIAGGEESPDEPDEPVDPPLLVEHLPVLGGEHVLPAVERPAGQAHLLQLRRGRLT